MDDEASKHAKDLQDLQAMEMKCQKSLKLIGAVHADYLARARGQCWQAVMQQFMKEVTDAWSIPADFMRLHDHTLSVEDKVLLELKIELHLAWGLYPHQRNSRR